jgi:hypothetical protein
MSSDRQIKYGWIVMMESNKVSVGRLAPQCHTSHGVCPSSVLFGAFGVVNAPRTNQRKQLP